MSSPSATIPIGYKQTEDGVIPDDWDYRIIGDIISVNHGKSQKNVETDYGRYPILGTGGVIGWTNHFLHDQPCVLIGRKGTIDKPQYMETPFWSVDTLFYCVVKDGYNAKYLFYQFCQIDWYSYNEASGVPSLNSGTIEKIKIPIPDLDEQNLIAEILTDFDAQIQALENLIEKKRNIKQGTMQELLTGKTRLSGFNEEWETTKLKDFVKTPVTDGPHLTPTFYRTGVPFLSVNNLVDNRVDFTEIRYISEEDHIQFSKKCKPERNDILLGKAASVGKVAIIDFDLELNIWSPLALIRVNEKNHPKFVFYCLQSHFILNQIELFTNSSTQGNIGMGDIELLVFNLPSKVEQMAIAEVLSDMDSEIVALEQRFEKAKAIKQGMMQQLLTGRIRLVDPSTPAEASA